MSNCPLLLFTALIPLVYTMVLHQSKSTHKIQITLRWWGLLFFQHPAQNCMTTKKKIWMLPTYVFGTRRAAIIIQPTKSGKSFLLICISEMSVWVEIPILHASASVASCILVSQMLLVSSSSRVVSVKIVDISMYHLSCKTWFYGAVKKALSLDMEEWVQ